MSLLPGIPKGLNITDTVDEFLTLLRSIETKLDTLIELQQDGGSREP